MIGRVGDDSMADRLVQNLQSAMDTNGYDVANSTTVRAGSRSSRWSRVARMRSWWFRVPMACIRPRCLGRRKRSCVRRRLCSLQLEIPCRDGAARAMEIAREADVPVVLDPAPMPKSLPPKSCSCDVICPNQSEAAAIVGYAVETVQRRKTGPQRTCLGTGGSASDCYVGLARRDRSTTDRRRIGWNPLESRRSTPRRPGDAFAGALTVRLAEGASLLESARFAGGCRRDRSDTTRERNPPCRHVTRSIN